MSKQFQIINVLRDYPKTSVQSPEDEINSMQSKIEAFLDLYEIGYSQISYRVGASVVSFEIVPETGDTMAKIRKLKDDIALSLCASSARIIAPIPGKGTIGIEMARQKPQIVGLKQILESAEFNDDSLTLPVACGIDTDNKPVVVDLAKEHHLLIGGATGQGKTTFLNTLIVSLLYGKSPEELKFLLIDPKMVEFGIYNRIKEQYLVSIDGVEHDVITDSDEALLALKALVTEMGRRYQLLQSAGCPNISKYNDQAIERLPYIVGIIDEYADLILTHGKDVETPLLRLAAVAHVTGIHLVIATQRPSKNVITGSIKASIPCRVAFKVFQNLDSKTVLDSDGAANLIGRGDMLLSLNGSLRRVQAPFVDFDEIDKICKAHNRYDE